MKSKEKRKVKPRFQRFKKIMTCSIMVISIPFLLCSFWLVVYFAGVAHAYSIADNMWLPQYPDSELIREYKGDASKLFDFVFEIRCFLGLCDMVT